jgi:hypothetical protein
VIWGRRIAGEEREGMVFIIFFKVKILRTIKVGNFEMQHCGRAT